MPDMPDMSGRLLLMSGRELIPCRTFCPACCNTHKMSDNKGKNHHWYWPVINWEKCLTWVQSAEGLPDILSGMLEIIFAITDLVSVIINRCPILAEAMTTFWSSIIIDKKRKITFRKCDTAIPDKATFGIFRVNESSDELKLFPPP